MADNLDFETPRLRLRPFRQDDLPYLQKYVLREHFWRFLPLQPQTPESIRSFLDERLRDAWGDGSYHCAVELAEVGHLIGTARVGVDDATNRSGHLGYAINDEFSGNGYMTEAVQQLLQTGFHEFGLHRIWAYADVENTASWRLMERVGMLREGLLRQDKLVRGSWRDSYLYSILEGDL